MEFQDRSIQCLDCKNDFIFTAGEQEFYERKGFRETPKRCKPCRDARKVRRDGGGARDGGGSGYANGNGNGNGYANGSGNHHADEGGRGPRGPRETFEAICAACGSQTRVPFRPANGRPVYCRECYSSRQGQGSGYGGGY